MVNQYETVFIVTPILSEEQVKETVEKFRDFLKKNGAEIVHDDHWGLKKMAYPIKHKSTGFYHLFEFKSSGELIDKLETEYRRDEQIVRFLSFRMDKFSIAYSEKRRRLAAQKKDNPKEESKKEQKEQPTEKENKKN